MRTLWIFGTVMMLLSGWARAAESKKESAVSKTVYDFKLTDIDGKEFDLSAHKGEVLLIVNVASMCGYTSQYTGLQKMYLNHKEKGLTIIGIPCNQFKTQEPKSDAEIKTFCTTTYKVTFPMMSKVEVTGEDLCPLYKYLTTESTKKGAIGWNFEKFLINRKGEVIERFGSKTSPEDPKVVAAIEKALAESK